MLHINTDLEISTYLSVCKLITFKQLDEISIYIRDLDEIVDKIRHFERTKNDILDNISCDLQEYHQNHLHVIIAIKYNT